VFQSSHIQPKKPTNQIKKKLTIGFIQKSTLHPKKKKLKKKIKNLGISFGIHDFFSFENNNGKFLLPFLVFFSSGTVIFSDNPNQTHGVQSECRRENIDNKEIKKRSSKNLKIC
jgi:hypothetical protein